MSAETGPHFVHCYVYEGSHCSCGGSYRGGRRGPDVAARIMDRLHGEALAEDEEREWQRTGRIRCSDCGATVRTDTLISLPEHGCTRRQKARRGV